MRLIIKVKTSTDIQTDLEQRVKHTVETIYDEILELVSARSMSREELRFSGHPYARRHGLKYIEPIVHVNTGRLKDSIKVKRNKIVFNLNNCPYIEYVREGTRIMLPRPFVREAIKNAQPKLRKIWQ